MNRIMALGILCCGALVYGVQKFRGGMAKVDTNWFGWGSASYGKETVSSLELNGSSKLDGTRVLGLAQANGSLEIRDAFIETLNVNGSVRAHNAEIGKLSVNGSSELNSSVIKEDALINGSLDSNGSTFQKNLSVAAESMILRASTVQSIIMRPIDKPVTQTIELHNGTHVKGSITFESGKGEVILYGGSQVAGVVTGGKIIQK